MSVLLVFDLNILTYSVVVPVHSMVFGMDTEGILRSLEKWSQRGKLENVTLHARDSCAEETQYCTHDQFIQIMDLRSIGAGEDPVVLHELL